MKVAVTYENGEVSSIFGRTPQRTLSTAIFAKKKRCTLTLAGRRAATSDYAELSAGFSR